MSVVANLSIFPLGDREHLGPYVARALKIIRSSGLSHRLGPMGTAIEGEFDQVMEVAGRCMRALEQDCDRVYMSLTVDSRKGRTGRLDGKVRSVEEALASESGH
ncbi:MAG: MTH1187 family thiamine-binding protein [Proteobacteria bacterium]|nr:MTH1187 family thiamine-binding protein [Pseudomonadota bacterium]MBU1612045.1 MTH1187 family thiamine-binding protein [Pseudomonadota bacterium]